MLHKEKMKNLSLIYDESFYEHQVDSSYISAQKYIEILFRFYQPKSVVDLGCGRGAWLKAFHESGSSEVVGFDGDWNSQSNMIDKNISFYPVDLNSKIEFDRKFDLAMSLEVAEHLLPACAKNFVESLINLSDMVLFGAAYLNQGGSNHINEQHHDYWANLFRLFGYVPFDCFRPIVWGDKEIPFWYQQNTFLYVRLDSNHFKAIVKNGMSPMINLDFMNCVHPELFLLRSRPKSMIKALIIKLIPKSMLPIALKIKHIFD